MRFRVPIIGNPEIASNFEQLEEGGWADVKLEHEWVAYGAPYSPPQYYKDPFEWVHLRGGVKNGVVASGIFILPKNFRPRATLWSTCVSNSNTPGCGIEVTDTGVVVCVGFNAEANTALKAFTSLHIPPFLAEQ